MDVFYTCQNVQWQNLNSYKEKCVQILCTEVKNWIIYGSSILLVNHGIKCSSCVFPTFRGSLYKKKNFLFIKFLVLKSSKLIKNTKLLLLKLQETKLD